MIDLGIKWLIDHFDTINDTEALWHPLGFCSATIVSGADYHLKVHYWPQFERRPKQPNWPIHTHKFELESLVLLGELTDIQYEVNRDGVGWKLYSVEYKGTEQRDSIWKDSEEKSGLIETSRKTYKMHDKYNVAKGIPHQSIVSIESETLTFVKTWKRDSNGPIIFGEEGGGDFSYSRQSFDKQKFWSKVHEVISIAS